MIDTSEINLVETKTQEIIKNQTNLPRRKSSLDERNSIVLIKQKLKQSKVLEPIEEYKSQIMPLEKELFENLNLEWGVDIISEDMPLIDKNYNNYYCHIIRTANPDPNKNNFFLIHGYISSSMHYICLIPYLIKRFNIFIPDTIGMGLSSRPQVKFSTPMQCEEYFISTYHIIIEYIFFKNKFNIKKEYYLCGHSLGGFIASRYMLRYPKGIKKVLLLSPAGITDYHIPGTNMGNEISCSLYCCAILFSSIFYCCNLRIQNLYRCCCFHKMVKRAFGTYIFKLDEDEIKPNKDGTKFIVNKNKISEILSKLAIISLEYPDDLNECAFYLFAIPPPAAYRPIERFIKYYNKIDIIFVFGKTDWMDKMGAYRLHQYDPNKYKFYTLNEGGHSFALENPKELCLIIDQYFEN